MGVLSASYIGVLGDGYGNIIGDPVANTEIEASAAGTTVLRWVSPYQLEVAVPALAGARFRRDITDVSQSRAAIKAIDTVTAAAVLLNENFVDFSTGLNPNPTTSTQAATSRQYPAGGNATVPRLPTLFYP